MKKILIIISLMILLFLFSCTKMEEVKNEKPDISSGEFSGNFLIAGYSDFPSFVSFCKTNGFEIVGSISEIKSARIKVNDYYKAVQILKDSKNNAITYFEPLYARKIIYSKSYPDNTRSDLYSYVDGLLNTAELHKISTGTGVTIAVVDTPVDQTHPDLFGVFAEGYDPGDVYYPEQVLVPGVNYQNDKNSLDDHGTHVSGIIAANNNDEGITGLAYNSKIMAVTAFRSDFSGKGYYYLGDDRVAKGIIWAVDHGARVISCSWGGSGYSTALKRAVDYAVEKNVVVIAAAGNENSDSVVYPAAYPGVISVVSHDVHNRLSDFSNYNFHSDIAAPGTNILSCVPAASLKLGSGEYGRPYEHWNGTSMAVPFVSAFAGLIISKYPDITPCQIKCMLESSTKKVEGTDTGRIDLSVFDKKPYEFGEKVYIFAKTGNRDNIVYLYNDKDFYIAKSDDDGIAKFNCIDKGKYTVECVSYVLKIDVSGKTEINIQEISK